MAPKGKQCDYPLKIDISYEKLTNVITEEEKKIRREKKRKEERKKGKAKVESRIYVLSVGN